MSGLDVESITQIRSAIKEETNELKDQLTREITLIVEPIKETLTRHIEHDEKRDEEVFSRLTTMDKERAEIKSDVKTGRVIGGGLWALCVAGFTAAIGYFKNGGS